MGIEAVNTWSVCLSIKQLDVAGLEILPGPLELAPYSGHHATSLWAKSTRGGGQDPD